MRKLFLLLICLFLSFLSSLNFNFAFAAGKNNNYEDSNFGIPPSNQDYQPSSASEEAWDRERDELIYQNYGSTESPSFQNTKNINPNEDDYDYGSTDGSE